MGVWYFYLGIYTPIKIPLRNLNDMDIRINRKKIAVSDITPSYFSALMNMTIVGHFSQYRDKR